MNFLTLNQTVVANGGLGLFGNGSDATTVGVQSGSIPYNDHIFM
jgi:hypothetical protein